MKAKMAVMQREADDFYSRYPGQTWKNVLSFGGGPLEHSAVQEVTFQRRSPARENLRTKAITEPFAPSVGELALRLEFGARLMPAYVRFDGDICLNLQVAEEPLAAIC